MQTENYKDALSHPVFATVAEAARETGLDTYVSPITTTPTLVIVLGVAQLPLGFIGFGCCGCHCVVLWRNLVLQRSSPLRFTSQANAKHDGSAE